MQNRFNSFAKNISFAKEWFCKISMFYKAKKNTFEYKKEKFGWSPEDFKEFNKSRAVTKENLIKKHGEEKGLEIFNNYCKMFIFIYLCFICNIEIIVNNVPRET